MNTNEDVALMSPPYDTMAGKVDDVSSDDGNSEGVTTQPADDAMSAGDLEALVRAAVVESIRDPAAHIPPLEDQSALVIAGPRVVESVRRAVMATIKELAGESAVLSAPLRAATKRLAEVSAITEKLWRDLQDMEAPVAPPVVPPVAPPVVPPVAPSAAPTAPAATNTRPPVPGERVRTSGQKRCAGAGCKVVLDDQNRSRRNAVYCTSCLVDATTVFSLPVVERDGRAQAVEPTPSQATPALELPGLPPAAAEVVSTPVGNSVVVMGRTIPFRPQASPQFKAFFTEFVARISQGPVRPSWVLERARAHGYMFGPQNPDGVVSQGTVAHQCDDYIGGISRWKDKDGEKWWSLPGTSDKPAGPERYGR